jgi:hypothetical protein
MPAPPASQDSALCPSTTPGAWAGAPSFTADGQGWGRLKNGALVFDDGGALGPDGQVMPAMHERAVTA